MENHTHITAGVYFILKEKIGVVKIGRSEDPQKRLMAMQTASEQPLVLFGVLHRTPPVKTEQAIHKFWAKNKIQGEWYRLSRNEIVKGLDDLGLTNRFFVYDWVKQMRPPGRPPLFGRKMQRVNTTIPADCVDYMRKHFGTVAEAIRYLVDAHQNNRPDAPSPR